MPTLVENEVCTGCGACASICPKSAISLKPDITGFLYPFINTELCIECKLCENVCPVSKLGKKQRLKKNLDFTPKYYIARNKDIKIREESTSGGFFSAIAMTVLDKGGVVFGASLDNTVVKHVCITDKESLYKLRGSKYVQSEIGNTFILAKDYLVKGRYVLFSGTPCQIEGLYSYLGKCYDNLITLDVMCRGVPSPKVFEKYINFRKKLIPEIKKINFRDKYFGYSYSTMAVYGRKNNDNVVYRKGKESDEYLRLFFNGYCVRNSCYNCSCQDGIRYSDFTLWDCFRVYKLAPQFDDNLGASNVICWTKKAIQLTEDIGKYAEYIELPFSEDLRPLKRETITPAQIDSNEFYEDLNLLSDDNFFIKYVPSNLQIKFKACIRNLLYRMKIYDFVRKKIHTLRDSNKG